MAAWCFSVWSYWPTLFQLRFIFGNFRMNSIIRAQWLISLFLVLRAHWFSGPRWKNIIFLSLQLGSTVEVSSGITALRFNWGEKKNLSFSLSGRRKRNFSEHYFAGRTTTLCIRISNADSKNQHKTQSYTLRLGWMFDRNFKFLAQAIIRL